MKKFISILAAVALCLVISTGCSKHAFSNSTNIFKYVQGESVKTVKSGDQVTIGVGETIYVYAASSDGTRLTGGKYTTESAEKKYAKAGNGTYQGESCITVTGAGEGMTSVSLNFLWEGFKLYKSIGINVVNK